jgi:hypothetical protein
VPLEKRARNKDHALKQNENERNINNYIFSPDSERKYTVLQQERRKKNEG